MSVPLRVFVPEWVPLDNKGEAAIVYGYMDGLFPGEDVHMTVLEKGIDRPMRRDGLHVLPFKWFYAPWRNRPFSVSLAPADLANSLAACVRRGLEMVPQWVARPPTPVKTMARFIRRVDAGEAGEGPSAYCKALKGILGTDYVIAGHDGVLAHNPECYVIRMLLDAGFSYGVFGTCLPVPLRSPSVHRLYADTFSKAQYFFTRNPGGVEWAARHFPGLKVEAAPDPAFAMRPAPEADVDRLIDAEGLADLFSRPVVMATVAENESTLRFPFRAQKTVEGKICRHNRLISEMVKFIVRRLGANVLFLPHCIGPTRRADDRRVAREMAALAALPDDRVRVLETECNARVLKGLIGRANMLVAERIHSLIGAVGMRTPFVCLGSRQDDRCVGIVEEQLGCGGAMFCMDEPDEGALCEILDGVWNGREEFQQRLERVNLRLQSELDEVRRVIRNHGASVRI